MRFKHKKLTLLSLFLMSDICMGSNPEITLNTSIKAVDTSTDAGTRESESELVMVGTTDTSFSRTATITLNLESGEYPDGYPKWSGDGLQNPTDGSTTVNWRKLNSSTIEAAICPGQTQSIGIQIVPPVKTTVALSFDPGSKIGNFVEKINGLLDIYKEGSKLVAGGKIECTFQARDKYNDGESTGALFEAKGSLSATVPDIEGPEIELKTPIPGVNIEFENGIVSGGITGSISGKFDEGSSPVGSISGQISAGITPYANAELELDAGLAEVSFGGKIEPKIGIQADFNLVGKNFKMQNGKIGITEVKGIIYAKVEVECFCYVLEKDLFNKEFDLSDTFDYNKEIPDITLFTLP